MIDNSTRYTQGVSSPKPLVKLFLYKIARDTKLWDFNHDFSKIPNFSGYVAMGGDPADIDIPSATVRNTLESASFARLPFDSWIPRITDFQIDTVTGMPNTGSKKLDDQAKAYFSLEDIDRANMKLHWKNLYGTATANSNGSTTPNSTYESNFTKFFNDRKQYLIDQINNVIALFSINREAAINRYNITDFLIKYTHDTSVADMSNVLDVELASDPSAFFASGRDVRLSTATALGEFHAGDNGEGVVGNVQDVTIPLIEENDVLEMRIKYMDDNSSRWEVQESGFIDSEGYQRVFMGYVSSMVRTMQYNNQERVNLVASGISKIFSLYDTSFTPSIAIGATGAMFESGVEMSDTKFSIWANNLCGKSTNDIFDGFMHAGLFCTKLGDAKNALPKMQAELDAAKSELAQIEQAQDTTDISGNPVTQKGKSALATKVANLEKKVADTATAINKQKQMQLSSVFALSDISGAVDGAATPPKDLDIEYYLPMSMSDPASTSFQLINYIPVLMSLARQYAMDDAAPAQFSLLVKENTTARTKLLSQVMATVEQAGYLGYKTMMQTAFKMFYPELKRPDAIFSELKENTFLELFEDRPGVIRLRPPKYNILNLNPDVTEYIHTNPSPVVNLPVPSGPGNRNIGLNAEYVIPASAIMAISVHRDDVAITTRADHTFETVFNGQALEGYTGHFTDAGYLMKYGLRTTGPQHNPMALSPKISAVLSAVRMAAANATARTITLTVFNNREYRLGRLYYIPTSLSTLQETNSRGIVSKGVVGYVTKIDTSLTYGQEATHTITLEHVRQAEVLEVKVKDSPGKIVYYANFKKLPDIATYMRLLATDNEFARDAATAVQQSDRGLHDAVSGMTSIVSDDGFMVIPNGLYEDSFSPDAKGAYSKFYSDKLIGSGIASKILKPSDAAIQSEMNNFITTIKHDAIQDQGQASLSTNFLAKLVTYDVDPQLKLYPKVPGIGSSQSIIQQIPNTESTQNRDVDDLMHVIYNLISKAVDAKYFGTSNILVPDQMEHQPIQVSSGLRFIQVPVTAGAPTGIRTGRSPGLITADNPQGTFNIKCNIFVGTLPASVQYNGRVVFAFVQTQDTDKVSRGNYNKFFVFHVPYNKSLRLANLINTDTLKDGGGCRQLETVQYYSGNPKAQGDMHSRGAALIFTNLGISLWGFEDILNSCIELDMATPNANVIPNLDKLLEDKEAPPADADCDMAHLIRSYVNCMVEPYNYVHTPPINNSYNASAVDNVVFNNATAALIMRGCLTAAKQVLNFKFATEAVAEVNRDLAAAQYFKHEFYGSKNLNERLFVPVAKTYFSTGSISGTGLFDKIASQSQVFPESQQPSLYTAVIQRFNTTTGADLAIRPAGSTGPADTYLLRSQIESNVSMTDIDNLEMKINVATTPLIPSTTYNLVDFIKGTYVTYPFLMFQLVDNMELIPWYKAAVYYYAQKALQGNALAALWHTSYSQNSAPFQSTIAEDQRTASDQYQKLNLRENY